MHSGLKCGLVEPKDVIFHIITDVYSFKVWVMAEDWLLPNVVHRTENETWSLNCTSMSSSSSSLVQLREPVRHPSSLCRRKVMKFFLNPQKVMYCTSASLCGGSILSSWFPQGNPSDVPSLSLTRSPRSRLQVMLVGHTRVETNWLGCC